MAIIRPKVTITDVAKAAGVSNSAVSYALNGKPGVSDKTRKKVLDVAEEMGWRPNMAAKALSVASTHTVGVIMNAGTKLMGVEPYFMEMFAGICVELEKKDYSLLLRFARDQKEELRMHKNWIASGSVDAVLIFNVEIGDARIELYQKHPEVPALVFSDPSASGGLPTISSNDADGAKQIVRYLHGLGHRHIAQAPNRTGIPISVTAYSTRRPRDTTSPMIACIPIIHRSRAVTAPSVCSPCLMRRPQSCTTTM